MATVLSRVVQEVFACCWFCSSYSADTLPRSPNDTRGSKSHLNSRQPGKSLWRTDLLVASKLPHDNAVQTSVERRRCALRHSPSPAWWAGLTCSTAISTKQRTYRFLHYHVAATVLAIGVLLRGARSGLPCSTQH